MKYMSSFFLMMSALGSCQNSELKVMADLPSYMKEISAVEITKPEGLLWVIEDAGNKNVVYGLDLKGKLKKTIQVENATNIDWEDLTTDAAGNLYIGDFGNNNLNRKNYTIYGILKPEEAGLKINAKIISFTLSKGMKQLNFEAFFEFEGHFYIISKANSEATIFSIPNIPGQHVAKEINAVKLKGKHTKITSADISPDGKTIALLTHDYVWTIKGTDVLSFRQEQLDESNSLGHVTQKEGLCFKDNHSLYITDERNKSGGGNIYTWKLKK